MMQPCAFLVTLSKSGATPPDGLGPREPFVPLGLVSYVQQRQRPSDGRASIALCGSAPDLPGSAAQWKPHRASGSEYIGPSWGFASRERDISFHSGSWPRIVALLMD